MTQFQRFALISSIAIAISSFAGPASGRASWTIRPSIYTVFQKGEIGSLPRRSMANGDFMLGVKGGTMYGLGIVYNLNLRIASDSVGFAFGLDVTGGRFQFGGDAFVGPPDSVSIESNDLCEATPVTISLALRLLPSNVFHRRHGWEWYYGGGGIILVSKLQKLDIDEAGTARIGASSVHAAAGFGGGIDFDGGLRVARWCIGVRGSLIAGGAKLEVKTAASSRWDSGAARFGPETFGLYLGYSIP